VGAGSGRHDAKPVALMATSTILLHLLSALLLVVGSVIAVVA
jgi:hypothetical protein